MRRPTRLAAGATTGILAALVAGSAIASAQEEADPLADLAGALDTGWLIIAAALVMFMQAGFALVEAGFVRTKNVVNILMKNILDVCLGSVVYWAIGFGLAYGVSESTGEFFGAGNFFLTEFDDYPTWFFQFAFAATAATIVSGAMAERTKFSAYLIYTIGISAVIYPIVSHWIWDANGWLTAFRDDPMSDVGVVDFAGSTVVHSVGGWVSLVGAIMVGPRLGKFNADGSANAIPGHSMPLGVLGMFILWIGWYGFNPGSTLGLSGGLADLAARVAVTTSLAAGAGGVSAMAFSWIRTGKSDLSLMVNGILGGLVGVTAGCATVDPWAAVVIGIVAGIIVVLGVSLLDTLRIDDPVGAIPVHLMNGIWGTLAVGLLSSESGMATAGYNAETYGLLLGGGADLLIVNLIGVVAVAIWTVATALVLFGLIRVTVGLRVSAEEEESGLDVGEHGMEAYPEFTGGRDPFGMHTGSALYGTPQQ